MMSAFLLGSGMGKSKTLENGNQKQIKNNSNNIEDYLSCNSILRVLSFDLASAYKVILRNTCAALLHLLKAEFLKN